MSVYSLKSSFCLTNSIYVVLDFQSYEVIDQVNKGGADNIKLETNCIRYLEPSKSLHIQSL